MWVMRRGNCQIQVLVTAGGKGQGEKRLKGKDLTNSSETPPQSSLLLLLDSTEQCLQALPGAGARSKEGC